MAAYSAYPAGPDDPLDDERRRYGSVPTAPEPEPISSPAPALTTPLPSGRIVGAKVKTAAEVMQPKPAFTPVPSPVDPARDPLRPAVFSTISGPTVPSTVAPMGAPPVPGIPGASLMKALAPAVSPSVATPAIPAMPAITPQTTQAVAPVQAPGIPGLSAAPLASARTQPLSAPPSLSSQPDAAFTPSVAPSAAPDQPMDVAGKAKAVTLGAAKGVGFLAAAAPGAAAGAEIGALGGPLAWLTIPAGSIIGGLISGTLGSKAVEAGANELAKHSDLAESFVRASQEHPYYDAAGNLVSFAGGLPKAATEAISLGLKKAAPAGEGLVSRLFKGAANHYENSGGLATTVSNLSKDAANRVASGATAGQAATAIASRVGGRAATLVAIDTALKEGGKALGYNDEGQTLSGATQAALIGAFTAGNGLGQQGYAPHEVADIVTRQGLRQRAGLAPDSGTVHPSEMPSGVDSFTAQALSKPLTAAEVEVANAFGQRVNQLKAEGKLPQDATVDQVTEVAKRTSALQSTESGKSYGVTSTRLEPDAISPVGADLQLPVPSTASEGTVGEPPLVRPPQSSASSVPKTTVQPDSPASYERTPTDDLEVEPSKSDIPLPLLGQAPTATQRRDPEPGDTFVSGGVRYAVTAADEGNVSLRPTNAPPDAAPLTIPRQFVDQQLSGGASQLEKAPAAAAQPAGSPSVPVAPPANEAAPSDVGTLSRSADGRPLDEAPISSPANPTPNEQNAPPATSAPLEPAQARQAADGLQPQGEGGGATDQRNIGASAGPVGAVNRAASVPGDAQRNAPAVTGERAASEVATPTAGETLGSPYQAPGNPAGSSSPPASPTSPEAGGRPSLSRAGEVSSGTANAGISSRQPNSPVTRSQPRTRTVAETTGPIREGEAIVHNGRAATLIKSNPINENALIEYSAEGGQPATRATVPDDEIARPETGTAAAPKRIAVPRQPGDSDQRAAAREWIADERQAGRQPTAGDVTRKHRINYNAAGEMLAAQNRAEKDAAPTIQSHAQSTPAKQPSIIPGIDNPGEPRGDEGANRGREETKALARGGSMGAARSANANRGPRTGDNARQGAEIERASREHRQAREAHAPAATRQGTGFHELATEPGTAETPREAIYRRDSELGPGIHYDLDTRTIVTSPERLAEAAAVVRDQGGNSAAWHRSAVEEELHHDRQRLAEGSAIRTAYEAVWRALPLENRETFAKVYPSTTPWVLGAEYERALQQRRDQEDGNGDGVTEAHFRKTDALNAILDAPQPELVERHLAKVQRLNPAGMDSAPVIAPEAQASSRLPSQPARIAASKGEGESTPTRARSSSPEQTLGAAEKQAFEPGDSVTIGGRAATVDSITGGKAQITLKQSGRKIAVPVATLKPKVARSFTLPHAPLGVADALDHIADQGGILSKTAAKEKGAFDRMAGDYDGAPDLRGIYNASVYGGSMAPDRMAQLLHDEHNIGDGSPDGLWKAIEQAVNQRRALAQDRKRGAAEESARNEAARQTARFERDASTREKGNREINTANLRVGDTVTLGGEKLKVTEVDPDTLDVTLEDHSRYGVQKVEAHQALFVEQVRKAKTSPTANVGDNQTAMPQNVAASQSGATPPKRSDTAGMLTLFHRTTPENAERIRRTGHFVSKENSGEAFFSTHRDGQNKGYGSAVVSIEIPEHLARLDDEFPDGEQHYAVPIRSLNKAHVIPESSAPTQGASITVTPKLRPGEKGTADLFQGEDQPFNLMGEKGIDHDARQRAQEQDAQLQREAKEKQDREQQPLFAGQPKSNDFVKARTTVADEIKKNARNYRPDLSTNSWGGERMGGGWDSSAGMSNNAVRALDAGKIMERDLPRWVADQLDVPDRIITRRIVNSANVSAQNIYPEYHHVGKGQENFYDPDQILLQPKFWTTIARSLKSKIHQGAAIKQAIAALRNFRQQLIDSGELGTWSTAKQNAKSDSALLGLEPQWRSRVESGEINFRDAALADFQERTQGHPANKFRQENERKGAVKQQAYNERRLAAMQAEHPAQRFLQANAGTVSDPGAAGFKTSEPPAPTRQEDVRMADRATAATSETTQSDGTGASDGVKPPTLFAAAPQIDSAYRKLVNRDGFRDVRISDLAKESGVPLAKLKPWIQEEARAGRAVPTRGDESLASPEARAAAVEIRGEPHLQVRLQDGGLFAARPTRDDQDEAGFVSQLGRTIESMPQETMNVAQAKAAIEKGSKPAEREFTGIFTDPLSPLAGRSLGAKVTRTELLEYAVERAAKTVPVTLGEGPEKWIYRDLEQGQYVYQSEREAQEHRRADEDWANEESTYLDERGGQLQTAEADDIARIEPVDENEPDGEQYGYWPYSDDPSQKFDSREDGLEWLREVREEYVQKNYLDELNDPEQEEGDNDTHFSQYTLPGADEGSYREAFVTWPENRADNDGGVYWDDGHSQYSSITNPITRLRYNTRTDADGKKTLFLEEIQGPSDANQQKMPEFLRKRIYEIGMKRALRIAADNGADSLSWTTGEQQADRYSLEKSIGNVAFSGDDETFGHLWAYDLNHREVLSEDVSNDKPLSAYLGKEVAAKILATPRTEIGGVKARFLSGLDLKTGGEGLKNLYDRMLPRIANDLVKKFGVKVGERAIQTPQNNPDWKDVARQNNLTFAEWQQLDESRRDDFMRSSTKAGEQTVHSLPIPDALRAHVQQGQALFASKPVAEAGAPESSPAAKKKARELWAEKGVESPFFKRWFGDSKVIDANGKPLVVYHGTNQNIRQFSKARLGANTGAVSAKEAFFFTENPTEAGEYADMSARNQVSNAPQREAASKRLLKAMDAALSRNNHDLYERLTLQLEESEQEAMSGEVRGANILPVFLSIKNPMVLDMKGKADLHEIANAIKRAKTQGRDGLRLDNVFDPVAERPDGFTTTQWVALSPKQIKSATGNRGTFDPNDANILRASKPFREAYESTVDEILSRGMRDTIPATFDSNETRAGLNAEQAANSVRRDFTRPHPANETRAARKAREAEQVNDLEAMPFVIEAEGTKLTLQADLNRVRQSKDRKLAAKYGPVVEHALANADRLYALRGNYTRLMEKQRAEELAAGITTKEAKNYVTRVLNEPELSDANVEPAIDLGSPGRDEGANGRTRYFTRKREFASLAHAIEEGFSPKSTNLADLTAHRVRNGQRLILERKFLTELQSMKAADGRPLIGDISESRTELNPDGSVYSENRIAHGYASVQVGDKDVIAHPDIAPILRSIYGVSLVRQAVLGRALLKMAALSKSYTLVFDTFHVGRMLFKMASTGGGLPVKFVDGKPQWNIRMGLALIENSDVDLDRMVENGEITGDEAAYARANRPQFDELVKAGMNVGRVADNLVEQAHVSIPGLQTINTWIFSKLSRGAMVQGALVAYERNLKDFPERTREENARQTAKEMNELFGNLQNQGVFKNKTFQDIARLIFLAPNWTESQFRYEARAYGQFARAAHDATRGVAGGGGKGGSGGGGNGGKGGPEDAEAAEPGRQGGDSAGRVRRYRLGNAARAFASGALALFAANQVINWITRQQFTWQNEEEGHKTDAFIPGGKRGFWFNPFEIAGEYAHAAEKYLAQHEHPLDVATHIASNKLSPLARGAKDIISGRDYAGRHFLDNGDRFRAGIVDALPSPMPFGGLLEKDPRTPLGYRLNRQPGSLEKQALMSIGAKVTPAASARTQMFALAKPFRADRGGSDAAGEYTDLRRALDNDDEESAQSEIKWLLNRGKNMPQIEHAVGLRRSLKDGSLRIAPELFTGSADREEELRKSLTPEQTKVYAEAQQDHRDNAAKFQQYATRLLEDDEDARKLTAIGSAGLKARKERHAARRALGVETPGKMPSLMPQ